MLVAMKSSAVCTPSSWYTQEFISFRCTCTVMSSYNSHAAPIIGIDRLTTNMYDNYFAAGL